MPQITERLSALFLTKVKKPGLYPDGGNLYLQVSGDGQERVNKSWLFKYEREGRKREMGLGSCRVVGLKDAREKAKVARQLLLDGIDPLAARDAERAEKKLAEAAALSFKQGAEQYIKAHRAGWKNAKHADQWSTSLETYTYPLIGDLPSPSPQDRAGRVSEPVVVKCNSVVEVLTREDFKLTRGKGNVFCCHNKQRIREGCVISSDPLRGAEVLSVDCLSDLPLTELRY